MRPDITYAMLVDFIARLSMETTVYPTGNNSYSNTSQQLRDAVEHVAKMENCMLRMSTFVTEARNMITHGGSINGSIKRPPKTNRITGR